MTTLAMIGILALAACGGGNKKSSTTTGGTGATASASVIIVDDIDCPKLVNHVVDVHAAANPEKSADAVAKIRVDTIKACEERVRQNPPTEAQKTSARCSMKAQTTAELEACGS